MKPETLSLYNKHCYYLFLLSNERLFLFNRSNNQLNCDKFFYHYDDVIDKHLQLKKQWAYYKKRRAEIIKKFEYEKIEILIRPYFCSDIKHLILMFIF